MESCTLFDAISSLEKKINCKLCSRETGIESKLPTNQLQFNLQDICNIYLVYLKPNLSKTLPSLDWCSLEAKNINTSSDFCSSCFTAGQKLLTMNERLNTIQSEIKCLIRNLSEEIIKFRRVTNALCGSDLTDIVPSENINSNDASTIEEDFLCEPIKEEPQIKQEIENEASNLFTIEEEDLYFSDNSSVCENQLEYDPLTDEPCSQQDNINLNNMILQDNPTNIQNASPPLYEHIKDTKVISRKFIESRQLVIRLERLPITTDIKKMMQARSGKSKIRRSKRKQINEHSNPVSSSRKQKALGKITKKLSKHKHKRELDKVKDKDDSDLDADMKLRRIFNKQRVLKKVRAKLKTGRNKFQCTPCDMTFVDSQLYIKHMEALHLDDPVTCYRCGKEFVRHHLLRQHMETKHPVHRKCEQCPTLPEFKDAFQYETHLMSHTGEIHYECNECHEKFSNPKTYCEHQKTSPCAIRLAKFKCDSCDELFAAKCFLLIHIAADHKTPEKNSDGRFECDMCDYRNIFTLLGLQSHYAAHTEEYIYSCDICGKGHRTREILIKHRKTHLSSVRQDYMCQFCGKEFQMDYYLQCHIQLMHVEENVTCEKCGKVFNNPHKFKRHLPDCGKSFPCEICGKQLTKLRSLRDHMRIHANENKRLQCEQCDKTYSTKVGLKNHIDCIHLKKRDFVCELCGKAFFSKQGHEQHLRNHNDEKAYECQICGEKFKYDNQLSDHNRLFHDAPLLQCKYCEERFKTRNQSSYHYKTAHQDLDLEKGPIECSVCGMCFDSRLERTKHRAKAHKELVQHKMDPKCHICGKVLSSGRIKEHLRHHERDNNGPFQCPLCDRRFLKKESLRVHKGKDHKSTKQNLSPFH